MSTQKRQVDKRETGDAQQPSPLCSSSQSLCGADSIREFLSDAREALLDAAYRSYDPIGWANLPGQIRDGERQLANHQAKTEKR